MKDIISIENYMDNSSKNYGVNSLHVTIGTLDLYFSYSTVVAYCTEIGGLFVSENIWGPTTGKHINKINSNKQIRLPRKEFEKHLKATLKKFKLVEPNINI